MTARYAALLRLSSYTCTVQTKYASDVTREMKKPASFRLTPACLEMLRKLAADKGVSQAAVVEMAIRDEYRKHEKRSK